MGNKNLRVPGTRHHHPVPKLQEGRQEDIMIRTHEFAGPPAPPSRSQAARRETRGDYDGRQDLAISLDSRHHHSVPKLQERETRAHYDGRQDGDGTPGTTIRLPSYTSYKKGDKRRL